MFFSFGKLLAFLLLFLVAVYYGGTVSLNCGNGVVDVHTTVVVGVCGCLLYFYGMLKKVVRKVFRCKPNHEKGLNSLQLAFSATLMKDQSTMEKSLRKAEKYLGNIPLVAWLKGQQSLISGDKHRAKAIFYGLCEREKNSILGAYSLTQLALNEKSDQDALIAINSVLKTFPHSQDLILQGIAMAVKNKNFSAAKKYMQKLKKSDKSLQIEAIVQAEEGIYTDDPDSLKKAFRRAPELSVYAVNYADLLIKKNNDIKGALEVLKKSFRAFPLQEIFDKCISICNYLPNLDKIKLARQLIDKAPQSWIGYFGLAKLFMHESLPFPAFQNLLIAFEIEPLDFIQHELLKVVEHLDDPKPPEVVRFLSQPPKLKHVNFVWKCAHCGSEESKWTPVCPYCNRIAEYHQIQTETHLLGV
jgi:tetratricopeptide (TPR) repeat protein